jgi:hypothetical protein
MWVDAKSLFSLVSAYCAFFIAAPLFFLLLPLNVSLFSFMAGFNSNWFICVGLRNLSLFSSSHVYTKVHMTVIIVMSSILS